MSGEITLSDSPQFTHRETLVILSGITLSMLLAVLDQTIVTALMVVSLL
jgi:hypothetical protein